MKKKRIISMLISLLTMWNINISAFAEDATSAIETTEAVVAQTTEYEEITDIEESTEESIVEEIIDEPEDEFYVEETTEYIPIEDIVLVDFEHEMYVEDTQSLSTSVFPQDATEQTVNYSSSNTAVATVNRAGVVTAISKGSCYIHAYSDDHTSSYELIVKVKTEEINVVDKFLILKPNQEMNLEASVLPDEAVQELQYETSDEKIVSVDSEGNIVAHDVGNASIIITNGEQTISVTVIVNNDILSIENNIFDESNEKNNSSDDNLVNLIKNSDSSEITVEGIEIVSQAALKLLYGTDKTLIIVYPEYNVVINGMDIANAENALNTTLIIESDKKGLKIKTEAVQKLPGEIEIVLKNKPTNYRYLYIYDEDTDEYTRLNSMNNNAIRISSNGCYYVTMQRMDGYSFNVIYIYIVLGIILVLSLAYIFSRKKYWFW
ncbi:MAG: Ig-like domain-containing protein [Ruminococcus sp.]|nr:Ig-like domain-containing protein [Ruminococcus sp.]